MIDAVGFVEKVTDAYKEDGSKIGDKTKAVIKKESWGKVGGFIGGALGTAILGPVIGGILGTFIGSKIGEFIGQK